MDISKITVGKRVGYTKGLRTGKGTVESIDTTGLRGAYVIVTDKTHPKGKIKLRPTEVSSAR